MSHKVGPIFARKDYAGFIRRTLALFLDAVILFGLGFAMPYAWYYLAPARWVTLRSYEIIDTVWLVGAVAYVFGMRLSVKGTLGYRIVGIRYAYMLSGNPPLLSLAFRATLAPVLMAVFALDHWWILVDKRKQAWHDKVTGFFVVKRHAKPIRECQMVQRVTNFMLLTFLVWEPVMDTPSAAKVKHESQPSSS